MDINWRKLDFDGEDWKTGIIVNWVNCSVRLFIQERSDLNELSRTPASRQAGIPSSEANRG